MIVRDDKDKLVFQSLDFEIMLGGKWWRIMWLIRNSKIKLYLEKQY